ncbi:MAG: peptidylprolyl isomerase [Planctomycetes bacterium]|nr:peptidylprolyl isomerase [Planctomycetota bacterium]
MAKEALIETTKGKIRIELFDRDCPSLVANFEKLAGQGFYNGLKFHRVIPDFMVQAGCPLGTGIGGPGYEIECEIAPARKHTKGALSMAHKGQCRHDRATGKKVSGKCTNGSQFFITHLPTPHLDGVHSVFGQVLEGQDVVDKIVQGDKMVKVEVVTK